jgi:DNA primase
VVTAKVIGRKVAALIGLRIPRSRAADPPAVSPLAIRANHPPRLDYRNSDKETVIAQSYRANHRSTIAMPMPCPTPRHGKECAPYDMKDESTSPTRLTDYVALRRCMRQRRFDADSTDATNAVAFTGSRA